MQSPFMPFRAAVLAVCAAAFSSSSRAQSPSAAPGAPWRSPIDVVVAADGKRAFVSDRTARVVEVVSLEEGCVEKEIPLRGEPMGLALDSARGRLYCAEYGAGSIAEIDLASLQVARRLPVGLRPAGIALAPRRGLLCAANTVTDDVSIVNLASGQPAVTIRVDREPFFLAVTPDEKTLLVGNLLPATPASDPESSAAVSWIDLEAMQRTASTRLPAGSTSVREIAISPDGRRAYVAHTVGRFNLPTTQSERGWIYTNAVSLLDVPGKALRATFLLDTPTGGAANPWGVELSPDGGTLWVSLRGVHEVARVDVGRLDRLLEGEIPETLARPAPSGFGPENFWYELKKDRSAAARLVDSLTALSTAGALSRFPLDALGPRGLALAPDCRLLWVAAYHSGELLGLDALRGRVTRRIALGELRPPDVVRRGEIIFHEGRSSFQGWMSCSSCHPDEGRTDGLRWDLLNDGMGTPQNTRSLLWAPQTRPTTARGVRPGYEASVPAGFHFMGIQPRPELSEPVMRYLESLTPESSPHRKADGSLSDAAVRGKAVFDDKGGCWECHDGPMRTDLKLHDIGTGDLDRPGERFVTKRLVELYRTAPYLHDGRAARLEDIFNAQDAGKRHGTWHELTPGERKDLVAFLLSL